MWLLKYSFRPKSHSLLKCWPRMQFLGIVFHWKWKRKMLINWIPIAKSIPTMDFRSNNFSATVRVAWWTFLFFYFSFFFFILFSQITIWIQASIIAWNYCLFDFVVKRNKFSAYKNQFTKSLFYHENRICKEKKK